MSLVREALATGALPRADVFAYTPTLPLVVHHEWGTGALLYAVWNVAGWGPAGLGAIRYALVGAISALAFACARRRGATPAAVAVLGPVAMFLIALGLFSPVRAGAFTLLFVAVLLLMLELDREGARWWILPWLVLHTVWVNMHGGFVVGVAIVGATALERLVQAWGSGTPARAAARGVAHLLAVEAIMAALALVNPYGWEYLPYLWRAIRLERPHIAEWAPLWDARVSGALLVAYGASVVIGVAAAVRAGRRAVLDVSGWAFAIAAAVAALLSARHLPIYALAWLSYAAPIVSRIPPRRRRERTTLLSNAPTAASLAVGAVGIGLTLATGAWRLRVTGDPGRDGPGVPVGAVDFLASSGFRGRLLTRFADGSYVSWRLYPAVRVSFDTRYEAAYVPGTYERYAALFATSQGWQSILASDPADAILVPTSSPLRAALDGRSSEWRCTYSDAVDAIYVRRSGAHGS